MYIQSKQPYTKFEVIYLKRDILIQEVKEGYANIASAESQQHFSQTTADITPEAYYEELLEMAISEISKGTFDNCRSGQEIINKIAADKTYLSKWKQ